MTRNGSLARLFRDIATLAAPPPELTVSEWADGYRILSPESCPEPGRWSTDRVPYLAEIMDAFTDPAVETVVVMTSSQVGKTSIIENVVGYHVDYDPSSILVVEPTLDMGQTFSKDRLAPMFRDTPVLRGKVKEARTRDSGNTLLHKQFPGGHITIAGANSPSGLASRPIRVLLCDEVDRFPASAGTEGDPVTLARKRTAAFWNRKIGLFSTPTIRGVSRIEAAYEESTQEKWCLPCPLCGRFQQLLWPQLFLEDMTLRCLFCGGRSREQEWKRQEGRWIAEKENASIRGFHLNELVSPWRRWEEIAADFRSADEQKKAGNLEPLKAWVNTSLGESWEETGDELQTEFLEKRREYYKADLPEGVLALTAGVDTQDDRLEVEVVGWGAGAESWGVEYRVLMGSPEDGDVWGRLDEYLMRTWEFEGGRAMGISCVCVDSGGHFTTEVYKFCRPREQRRIFAIKGRGGTGIPLIGKPTRSNRVKAALFAVGVDTGKENLFHQLRKEHEGPGYCHFPRAVEKGYDASYFRGLTSEKRVMRFDQGRRHLVWVKRSGARNEPLDCRIYARAALEILNPNLAIAPKAADGSLPPVRKRPSAVRRSRRMISRGIG